MKKLILQLPLMATISSFAASGWWEDYVTIDINGAGSTAPTGWYWIEAILLTQHSLLVPI